MAKLPLTLRGTLSQLQRAVAKYYSQLQQRFESNYLISGMWAALGHDLQAQVESLGKLPHSFWLSVADHEKELMDAAGSLPTPHAETQDRSLQISLAQTIELEEPIILKVYAPLTRHLRRAWTEQALDFYVIVKAHIARVAQSVQLFSGDPALSQRCALLLQSFEKEVQEPLQIPKPRVKKRQKKAVAASRKIRKSRRIYPRAAIKKESILSRVKAAKRPEPMVRKIKLSRRRARR